MAGNCGGGVLALHDQRRQRDVVADREAVDGAGAVDHQRRLGAGQHGDGCDLHQEAQRRGAPGSSRSMTKPSTTRPTSAITALTATARPGSTAAPAAARPAISGTRWVRKPTCDISTKAKGAEMLQKCQCLSGSRRLCLSPVAGRNDSGPRRTNNATAPAASTRPITTSHPLGLGKAQPGNGRQQRRRHHEARHRGAAQRQVQRQAALAVEPLADGRGDRRHAGGVPARRHQGVEHDELPRRRRPRAAAAARRR